MKAETRDKVFTAVGIFGIAGFFFLYAVKLFGQHGAPKTIRFLEMYIGSSGLIVLNILVLACFLALLPYRRASSDPHWKSKGAFFAFLIALFTEMFGLPLVLYIFSPFFDYPFILPVTREIFGSLGMIVGTWVTLAGILLVFFGWRRIHRAKSLVTDGLYGYIRHPQYVGLFLIISGWLIHWPTLLTLILFPVIVGLYYRLALKEEEELRETFGREYVEYAARTPRFFPRLGIRKSTA